MVVNVKSENYILPLFILWPKCSYMCLLVTETKEGQSSRGNYWTLYFIRFKKEGGSGDIKGNIGEQKTKRNHWFNFLTSNQLIILNGNQSFILSDQIQQQWEGRMAPFLYVESYLSVMRGPWSRFCQNSEIQGLFFAYFFSFH